MYNSNIEFPNGNKMLELMSCLRATKQCPKNKPPDNMAEYVYGGIYEISFAYTLV